MAAPPPHVKHTLCSVWKCTAVYIFKVLRVTQIVDSQLALAALSLVCAFLQMVVVWLNFRKHLLKRQR